MMMKNSTQIAFFSAREFQKSLLEDKSNVHYIEFLPLEGWFIDGEVVANCPSSNSTFFKYFDQVLSRLIKSGPIFSRHHDDLPSMELVLRSTTLSILAIAERMAAARIDKCVLGTAASHHLSTLMLEIACQISGTEQIFEYYIFVSEDRVLPLRQSKSIMDRSPLGRVISNFSYANHLETWAQHGYSAISHEDSSNATKNFYSACLSITVNRVRNTLWRIRTKGIRHSVEHREQLKSTGLRRDLQILNRQRNALHTLNRYIQADDENNALNPAVSRPHFLIMAHLQPEATSFPEGGEWHNFIDIVVELRQKFPEMAILYKEHPASFYYSFSSRNSNVGIMRSPIYYGLLRQLGCFFIDENYHDLHSSLAVHVTISGSVTLERSLQGLPTVVMGEPWYKGVPGMIRLESVANLNFPLTFSNTIQSEAITFLDNLLSGKTFENRLLAKNQTGITNSKSVFLKEYKTFIEALIDGDQCRF
jgi:hypothetical protein